MKTTIVVNFTKVGCTECIILLIIKLILSNITLKLSPVRLFTICPASKTRMSILLNRLGSQSSQLAGYLLYDLK